MLENLQSQDDIRRHVRLAYALTQPGPRQRAAAAGSPRQKVPTDRSLHM
jgi:hypothetical protein